MSINEINEIYQMFGSLGIGGIIGAGITFYCLKSFLPAYFSSKAQNLATKEDIGYITNEIEQVKLNYAEMLEEVRSDHQLKLASIQREKNLKKEVYLDSVEALMKYQSSLTLLSDLDTSNEVVSESFSSGAAQMSKIIMVGSSDTVKILTELIGEVATAYMALFLERTSLMSKRAHIDILETYRKKHRDEIDNCLKIIKNMNLEGISDPESWIRIKQYLERELSQRDDVTSEINECWSSLNKDLIVFAQRCMSAFYEINELTPHLLLSVRAELDLELDKDEYIRLHNNNTMKMKMVFDDYMSKMQNNLEEGG